MPFSRYFTQQKCLLKPLKPWLLFSQVGKLVRPRRTAQHQHGCCRSLAFVAVPPGLHQGSSARTHWQVSQTPEHRQHPSCPLNWNPIRPGLNDCGQSCPQRMSHLAFLSPQFCNGAHPLAGPPRSAGLCLAHQCVQKQPTNVSGPSAVGSSGHSLSFHQVFA